MKFLITLIPPLSTLTKPLRVFKGKLRVTTRRRGSLELPSARLLRPKPLRIPPPRLWPHLLKQTLIRHLKERPYLLVALALLAIFLPLALLLTLKPKTTSAAWFDDNWAYRQKSAITNSGSATRFGPSTASP